MIKMLKNLPLKRLGKIRVLSDNKEYEDSDIDYTTDREAYISLLENKLRQINLHVISLEAYISEYDSMSVEEAEETAEGLLNNLRQRDKNSALKFLISNYTDSYLKEIDEDSKNLGFATRKVILEYLRENKIKNFNTSWSIQ